MGQDGESEISQHVVHCCMITLVPCDFDISPLPSDQRRRYRQSKVGSLLVSPRLFVRQICYERLKRIALTRQ